eukprot:tig00000396_g24898.t1
MMAYTQIYEKDLYEKQLKALQRMNAPRPPADYTWMAKSRPEAEQRLPSAISTMMDAASQALALEREYGKRIRDSPRRPASGGVVRPAVLANTVRRPAPVPPHSQPELIKRREPPPAPPILGVRTNEGLVSPRVVLRRPPGQPIEEKQNQNLTSSRREAEATAAAPQVPSRAEAYEKARKSRGYVPPVPKAMGTVDSNPNAMQPGEDGLPPASAVRPAPPRRRSVSSGPAAKPRRRSVEGSASPRGGPAAGPAGPALSQAALRARKEAADDRTANAVALEKQKAHMDEQKRLLKAFDQDKLIQELAREIMHGDPERILAVYDRIPEQLDAEVVDAMKRKALAMANLEAGRMKGRGPVSL